VIAEPDRNQIETFVRVLFKHVAAGNWLSLRTFSDEGKKDLPFQITPVKFNGNFEPLIEAACRDARVAANNPKRLVFCPPVATFANSDHARVEDLAEGPVLSVECDQQPLAARQRLEQLIGVGTIVDHSGGEWVNPETGEVEPKLHLFWRLRRPTTTPAEHATLREVRRLATELVDGDTSNISPVHPIRWAGSWHRKGEPKLCRIVECHPEVEIELDPTLAILQAVVAAEAQEDKSRRGRTDDEIVALLELSRTEGQWHNAILKAIASMIGRGWSDSAIKMICGPYCDDEHRDTDLLPLIEGARRKWNKPEGEPFAPAFSEEALALSFARRHDAELRNVAQWSKWLRWDGARWVEDHTRKVFDLSRQICREAASQANKGGKELAKAKTRAAVVSLASDDRRLAATVEQWDADIWALNTPGRDHRSAHRQAATGYAGRLHDADDRGRARRRLSALA
jgi:hypothetical protein